MGWLDAIAAVSDTLANVGTFLVGLAAVVVLSKKTLLTLQANFNVLIPFD